MPFQRGQPRPANAGRRAGTPNKVAADFRERILRSGLSPADFLAATFRDETQPINVRVDCAKTLCSFLYPRLANVDIGSANGAPLVVQVLRFSDTPVEPNKQLVGSSMIEMTADAATEAVEATAGMVIEATRDGEEEC